MAKERQMGLLHTAERELLVVSMVEELVACTRLRPHLPQHMLPCSLLRPPRSRHPFLDQSQPQLLNWLVLRPRRILLVRPEASTRLSHQQGK